MKRTSLAVCGLMWHRKDIQPARLTVIRSYKDEQVLEALRMDRRKERPFFTPGFARTAPLQHATRFRLDGGPARHRPGPSPT